MTGKRVERRRMVPVLQPPHVSYGAPRVSLVKAVM
jgi:hypothetical protein